MANLGRSTVLPEETLRKTLIEVPILCLFNVFILYNVFNYNVSFVLKYAIIQLYNHTFALIIQCFHLYVLLYLWHFLFYIILYLLCFILYILFS